SGSYVGIPEDSDGIVRRVEKLEHRTLKKTDDGFSVSRVVNGEELYSHLDSEGRVSSDRRDSLLNLAQLTTSPSSQGIRSWVFQPNVSEIG
ncbi:hypothetical protein AZE42_11565, partial [Rhizopogon vesiculosus]